MSEVLVRTVPAMGTVVTFQVVGHGETHEERIARDEAVNRAAAWFQFVESACTRFDERSELRQVSAHVGKPVAVGDVLFEAIQFALEVARETNGAFDPTVGAAMERRGFDHNFRTGAVAHSTADTSASFRDVQVDIAHRTVTITRPLTLDLGAVAKGFAVDLAARELRTFTDFAIDAGGDLYLGGHGATGDDWRVGVRHPRDTDAVIESVRVSGAAVCTSGDYARLGAEPGEHHIVDPATHHSPHDAASATVIAPTAMLADALATAAMVLGPAKGVALLEQHGVNGVIYTPTLERHATRGMAALAASA